ncbi:hypothetical protein BKA81DRAFT_116036 [Phyllosticta paracitricarpa]
MGRKGLTRRKRETKKETSEGKQCIGSRDGRTCGDPSAIHPSWLLASACLPGCNFDRQPQVGSAERGPAAADDGGSSRERKRCRSRCWLGRKWVDEREAQAGRAITVCFLGKSCLGERPGCAVVRGRLGTRSSAEFDVVAMLPLIFRSDCRVRMTNAGRYVFEHHSSTTISCLFWQQRQRR